MEAFVLFCLRAHTVSILYFIFFQANRCVIDGLFLEHTGTVYKKEKLVFFWGQSLMQ
jgi:hypothetical protein